MTSDLERDLQLALREGVGHVTPDRLRHDGPTRQPTITRRLRWAVAGPILAAVCVAVLALAISLVATNRHDDTRPAGGRPISLDGTSWTLVAVRHAGTTTSVPESLHAGVAFLPGGVLGADDGINSLSGAYTPHGADTILVRGISATQAGYGGHDPGTVAAINGIGAILNEAGGEAQHVVTVQRQAGTLTLAGRNYTLTFSAAPPTRGSSAPATASAP